MLTTTAAENIAHANTPGYKARDVKPFAESYGAGMDKAVRMRATRDGHFGETGGLTPEEFQLDAPASANGNSVSIETEMLRSVDVKRQHDRALAIYKHSMDVLRMSLGRR